MNRYKNLLLWVKNLHRLSMLLKILDLVAVIFTVCAFAAVLIGAAISDPFYAVKLMAVCGIPFILVSLFRKILNAPRPYELFDDIYELPPKKKDGCSFPSRHVFSAFSIGAAICFIYPIVGAVILVFGVAMSLSRVLLGKHFPRDVIAGALIGAVTSVIGMIIMI